MRRFTLLIGLVCALAFMQFAFAEAPEMVDNPSYKSWAAHKPGTSIAFDQNMNISGMSMTKRSKRSRPTK